MKIAFYALREYDELKFLKQYSEQYGMEYVYTTESINADNISLAEGCQGFCSPPCLMKTEWIDRLNDYGVKYFFCRSIGFDHLPIEYMKRYNMKVTNSPYPPECVANYAIMLILMATRKVNETMRRAALMDYSLKGKMGRDLGDLTVGVVGTGHIGSTVIRHLSGFGCRILTHSRHENEELKKYATYVDVDQLLSESDVITLHLASNTSTDHFINAETIAKMKDGVILVNTARGSLIDSQALISSLKTGKIGGAALDVFEDESALIYKDNTDRVIDNDAVTILRTMPNVIFTPHMSFYTETTVSNMVEKAFISALCYEQGKESPFQIN